MMKFIFLVFSGCMVCCSGCGRQQNKFVSIEEKQKQALEAKNIIVETPPDGPFNFRLAARLATPAVVHIKSQVPVRETPDFFRDFFDGDFWRRSSPPGSNSPNMQMGSASGVIVSNDGYIVTNNHVVEGAQSLQVILHDQRSYLAKVIGTSPETDLALLKIEETNLSFIQFGNSDSVEVGDLVLAVGNPFNLASTVTAGIVSAKARNINILTDKAAVESYIQTDAAVNKGNSGGALVDIRGKLIGINSAISTPTGAYAGYSFAIPVEMVKKTIDDLLKYGKIMRGYLGVIISDMTGEKAKSLGISIPKGVLVDSLQPNGAAFRAGLKPMDVIIRVNEHVLESAPALREIVARHRPGEKLDITVIRAGREKLFPVILLSGQEAGMASPKAEALLKNLGIEIENLSAQEKKELKIGSGIKVIRINEGIIARDTDMREGFVITKANRKTIGSTDAFINELQNYKGGILIEGIYPGIPGEFYYAIGL